MAIQNTLAYTIASVGHPEAGTVALFRRSIRKLNRVALPLLALGLICSPLIASFFKIPTVWPVVFCAVCLLFNLYYPVLSGIAQGRQHFVLLTAASVAGVIIRLVSGVGLVAVFHSASAALAGTALACGGTALAIVIALRRVLFCPPDVSSELNRKKLYEYFWPVFFSVGVLNLAMNADLLLVKRFFDADVAGQYARAGAVARLICYITGPVLIAIFPKVAAGQCPVARRRIFFHGFGLSLLVVGAAVSGCLLLPQFPALLLFKTREPELLHLIRLVVLAFGPLPLLMVVVHYLMARKQFLFLRGCVPVMMIWIATAALWHPTVTVIIAELGCAGILLLTVSLLAARVDFRAMQKE
ncbi:MAG: oligosaccharide flippase family protein [Kiritimatiellales bacterium]